MTSTRARKKQSSEDTSQSSRSDIDSPSTPPAPPTPGPPSPQSSRLLHRPLFPYLCYDCNVPGNNRALPKSHPNRIGAPHPTAISRLRTASTASNASDDAFPLPGVAPGVAPLTTSHPNSNPQSDPLSHYVTLCSYYTTRPNPGILTALRFALTTIRPTPPFHDRDALPLADVFFCFASHGEGEEEDLMGHVTGLDFTLSAKVRECF